MSNFKDTLNILTTTFEMKANLPAKEPTIQQEWIKKDIYQKILAKNKNKKQKILHDGPPYANGTIHCGHALNKILKDIIIRQWNMEGFYSHYIPGWDTHGMPIEHALIKKGLNIDKNLTIGQKRENCKQFAREQIEIQKKGFARLGLATDFKDCYYTLTNDFEADELWFFLAAIKQELVYQDLKPVFWSWSSQTALADAEVEYSDEDSYSIYVTFDVVEGNHALQANDKLLIWTTTPWTIPTNLAIAVHPTGKYVRVSVNNVVYVVAQVLLENVSKVLSWENPQVLTTFSGKEIENVLYKHPLYTRQSPIILAEYVSFTDGTGLVHNAPDFGEDDYLACKKYNIKPIYPMDAYGKFNEKVNDGTLVGLFYEDANQIVCDYLTKANALLKVGHFSHSVAHDWRTKKPVIYRSTKQWFIDFTKIKSDILNSITNVNFPSELSRKQLVDMITNRTEWCISRQRYWGVPIPIIYDEKDNPIYDIALIKNIIDIIRKESSNAWFDKPVEYFLTPQYSGKTGYRKETDILDVWFDSGTSFTTLKDYNLTFPAEMYLEGKDQFRGWFNSSLINGVICAKKAPYKTLLGCGFVLDAQGRKMSKSIGNVIDPISMCDKFGADILRLWVASSNYKEDVRISDGILTQVSEVYRRIRNSLFKFILANISDFNYATDKQTSFDDTDALELHKLKLNIEKINNDYKKFNYIDIIETTNNHVLDLSAGYFNIIKDALYCNEKDDQRRRTIQTVLFHILNAYLILLAPILVHTTEEAYQVFNKPDKKESIHLEDTIVALDVEFQEPNMKKWDKFNAIKDAAFTEIEKLRKDKGINKNTEATVTIAFNNEFDFSTDTLAKYLNVAKVIIEQVTSTDIKVTCTNEHLVRCERCWNYYDASSLNEEHLCSRCCKVLKK